MEQFDVTCRTCNEQRPNLVNLSSNAPVNDSLTLRDILLTVCPFQPVDDNDEFPQRICHLCSKQLEIAYKFQLQCKKSQEELSEIVAARRKAIKEERQQIPSPINDESLVEGSAEKSCQVDEDDDPLCGLSDDLEFLDEYCEMESNDTDDKEETIEEKSNGNVDKEETIEETTQLEVNHPESVSGEIVTPAESEAVMMCCHCDKKFFTMNGLYLHEKLTHKNLKNILIKAEILTIECKYCRQVFERKSELKLHCQFLHRNELANELTCNTCEKVFADKSRYEHHLLYHSKHRYYCTVKDCKRSFIIKYKMTDHMKRFHGVVLTMKEKRALKPIVHDEE